jgi:hypothetical protein
VPKSPGWLGPLFVVGVGAALLAAQIALHGSFDLSSVSSREDFIAFTVGMTLVVALLAALVHLAVDRSIPALLVDWTALSLAGTLVSITHPLALGWHVGYPAAPAELQFFPYFAALALGVINGLGLIAGLGMAWRASRRLSSPPTARP